VLKEAHKVRLGRGAPNIEDQDLADALIALSAASIRD
jgi:hypothetical protein